MTAVTQTEAFVKLDEGTVKDFITKVLRYFQHYTLPRLHKVEPSSRDDGEGGGLTQNRNCKMESPALDRRKNVLPGSPGLALLPLPPTGCYLFNCLVIAK